MKQRALNAVKYAALIGGTVATTVGFSVFATSVGTNISVDGTLSVSGGSTFGDAAADINIFTGTLQASTTALFTSGATFYSTVTLQNGETIANSTDGQINVDGNFVVGGYATTTASNGNFATMGTVTVGTNGTAMTQIKTGYISCGPIEANATIAATSTGFVYCTGLSNISANDAVFLTATTTSTNSAAGVIYSGRASTSATNVVSAAVTNLTGVAWTVTTSTWRYLIIR